MLCPCSPLPDSVIGTEITLVTGNDVDSGPVLSYSLQLDASSQGKFDIHRYNGRVSLTAPLDFEERTWYTLTIRASDSKHQSEANLTVLVEDINDNAPTFTQDLYQVTFPYYHFKYFKRSDIICIFFIRTDEGLLFFFLLLLTFVKSQCEEKGLILMDLDRKITWLT